MTDARPPRPVQSDRIPEFASFAAASAADNAAVAPRRAQGPRNPWLVFVLILWIATGALGFVLTFSPGASPDADDAARGLAVIAHGLGAFAILLSVIFFAVWIGVKAVLWRPNFEPGSGRGHNPE